MSLIITKSRVDFSLPILYYGIMSNFKRYYQDKNIVFITIVTYNRQQILVKNIELLRQSFKNVKYSYEIVAGIVLPDYKETVRMRKVGQQNEKFAICVQLSRKFFNFV